MTIAIYNDEASRECIAVTIEGNEGVIVVYMGRNRVCQTRTRKKTRTSNSTSDNVQAVAISEPTS